MPIFDFNCLGCRHEFEYLLLKNGDGPLCPQCGCRSVSRRSVSLFNCSGVQLTKQLKLDSEETMKRGRAQMKKETLSHERIKIL